MPCASPTPRFRPVPAPVLAAAPVQAPCIAFVMGVFFAQFGPRSHPLLMTGILGGFTTFSAFSLDALKLWQGGQPAQAALYVGLSVVLSLSAVALGAALARGA